MNLPEGLKIRHGVFTSDRVFAKMIIDNLKLAHDGKVEKYINSTHELSCYMDDGTIFIWLGANESIRGFRCARAVVDISTCSVEFIQKVIKPICIYADKEDFEIVTSEDTSGKLFEFINQLEKIAIIKGDIPVYYNDFDNCPNDQLGFKVNEDGLNLYG